MRRKIFALFLLAGIGCIACSRDLSRSSASKLISENERFVEPKAVKVPVGKVWFDYRNVYDAFPLHELEDAGIINVFETGRTSGMWNKEYAVRLTSDGERQMASWKRSDEKIESWFAPGSPDAVVYLIPVATRKLDEVTGIRQVGERNSSEAVAEFLWHWEPTEAGRKLVKETADEKPKKTEALFQRYDDGWRVAKLQLTVLD